MLTGTIAMEAMMNTGSAQTEAQFALELDRQNRELLAVVQGKGLGMSHLMVFVWPIALLAMAVFDKGLSSREQFIAFAAALGLLSLLVVVEIRANRRAGALLRLLERRLDMPLS